MIAESPRTHNPDLVTVYWGTLGVAKTLQATLESAGFPTFMPQENMKTLHPFTTGANSLTVTVQVAGVDAGAVHDFLDDLRTSRTPGEGNDEQAPVDCHTRLLATRIAWSLVLQVMVLGLPWPWLLAPQYFRMVAKSSAPPPQHARTIGVLIASVLLCLGSAGSLLWLV